MGKAKREKQRARVTQRAIAVELRRLEIAVGHDGLLRGKPEPVVLLAAVWVGAVARTIGRVAVRFGPIGRYPCDVTPAGASAISGRTPADGHLVLLAVALEEDAGSDVARVYGLLESVGPLRFWNSSAEVPAPVGLEALVPRSVEPVALPVHVLEGSRDLGDRCAADTWIGAWAVGVPGDGGTHSLRLRFASADGKNDWTALVDVHREAEGR